MKRIAIFVLCLLLIFSVSVAAAPAKQQQTDETYILSDGTVSTLATYHGDKKSPTVTDGRKGGKAVQLNGADYLSADITELTAPFTLSAWVNWQGETANQRIFTLQKKDSENFLSLSPWTDTQVVGKPVANGVTLLTSCFKEEFLRENYYTPSINGVQDALKKNTWHHIAFTVNEDTVTVYIDGVNFKTVTLPFTYTELGADTLYIGNTDDGANGFVGQIQDFTLHYTALDAETVARMAKDVAKGDTETPVDAGSYAAATLPTADALQQVKSVVLNDKDEAVFTDTVAAFWEKPQVATGQTVSGTLTVQNKSGNPINLQLAEIVWPAVDTPAYRYLSEIKVTVKQDDVLLYDGPYTELRAEHLALRWQQLPNDRTFTYAITLSRPFSSTAKAEEVNVVWKWETAVFPINRNPLHGVQNSGWLLIVLGVSAMAVCFSLYWAIVRKERRVFTVWDTVAGKVKSLLKKNEKVESTEETDQQA